MSFFCFEHYSPLSQPGAYVTYKAIQSETFQFEILAGRSQCNLEDKMDVAMGYEK